MSRKRASQWEVNKALAAGVLADRNQRRRALAGFALAMMGMVALGMWGIDGWLKDSIWRFGLYWGACGLLCLFVMAFALFDARAAIREERERMK